MAARSRPSLGKATEREKVICRSGGRQYASRWKPKACEWGFEPGGSFKPTTTPKVTAGPKCVKVFRVETTDGHSIIFYSIRTTTRDDRCFALHNTSTHGSGSTSVCYNKKCKDLRSSFYASGKLEEFACEHLNVVSQVEEPIYQTSFSAQEIAAFTPDFIIQNSMEVFQEQHYPTVVKISSRVYAVRGEGSTTNPMSYGHVKVEEQQPGGGDIWKLKCVSESCKKPYGRTKHVQRKKLCLHIHYALLARKLKENVAVHRLTAVERLQGHKEISNSVGPTHADTVERWQAELASLTLSRASTLTAQLNRALPYEIPPLLLKRLFEHDAATHLALSNGWSTRFVPSESDCSLCGSPLSEPTFPTGQGQGTSQFGNAFLVTNLNPFKRIQVMVKKCKSRSCEAVYQSFPFEQGKYI